MEASIKYQRKIIGVERKLGFLYIPAQGQEFMPFKSCKFPVLLQGDTKASSLSYNSDHKRIFGLTGWYSKNKIEAGAVLEVELTKSSMKLSLSSEVSTTEEDESEELI